MSSTSVALSPAAKTPLAQLQAVLTYLFRAPKTPLIPGVPNVVKLLALLILFLNRRSLPFVWHVKLFKPALWYRWELFVNRDPNSMRRLIAGKGHVGKSPFDIVSVIDAYAGLDDCDYNNHLSNSSYAKNVDHARMKACIETFPPSVYDRFVMPLGGAHYLFIREIKVGTPYQIRSVIGTWEEKWAFLVHYFVTYPKNGSNSSKRSGSVSPKSSTAGVPNITAPSSPNMMPQFPPNLSFAALASSAAAALPKGAMVHCIAVSNYCCKMGRITIPPRVVFIASGFGDASKKRYSRIQDLRFAKPGSTLTPSGEIIPPTSAASKSKSSPPVNLVPQMYRGGWKTDTTAPGFWDLDEYETQRQENMEKIFGGLHESFSKLKEKVTPAVSPK